MFTRGFYDAGRGEGPYGDRKPYVARIYLYVLMQTDATHPERLSREPFGIVALLEIARHVHEDD
jgi:hypothetical protein